MHAEQSRAHKVWVCFCFRCCNSTACVHAPHQKRARPHTGSKRCESVAGLQGNHNINKQQQATRVRGLLTGWDHFPSPSELWTPCSAAPLAAYSHFLPPAHRAPVRRSVHHDRTHVSARVGFGCRRPRAKTPVHGHHERQRGHYGGRRFRELLQFFFCWSCVCLRSWSLAPTPLSHARGMSLARGKGTEAQRRMP